VIAKQYYGRMKKLWSIPAIGLYFYIATVLTNWGFLSYFNIPSTFVQASLSSNIIFFYQFIKATLSLLGSFHWYVYVAVVFFFIIAAALYYLIFDYNKRLKNALVAALTILLFFYLGTFFKLGNLIASTQTNYIVPINCSVGSAYAYVIPLTDENQTILKNTADLSCTFENKSIGEVTH
jgi:hypothetical protein